MKSCTVVSFPLEKQILKRVGVRGGPVLSASVVVWGGGGGQRSAKQGGRRGQGGERPMTL